MRCDLTEAIEDAAWDYFWRALRNRLIRLIGRRTALALGTLLAGIIVDGPLSIGDTIGLVISIGIVIWTIIDVINTIRYLLDTFRSGMLETFRRIARTSVHPSMFNCLDRKPECCQLAKDHTRRIVSQWARNLRPGWKRRGRGGHASAHRVRNQLRRELAGPLAECCT